MKVIESPTHYKIKHTEISVFLAGGICNCEKWQTDVIKHLERYSCNGLVVFNPRRKDFPIGVLSESAKQIEWEFNALENADIFSMYFASGVSDQPICMYELGRNILNMQIRHPIDWKSRIIISIEDGYKRKQDVIIQTGLACGHDLFVQTDSDSESLRQNHAERIIKTYRKLVH